MRCKDIRLELADFVSGHLSPDRRESVAGHLAACSACRDEAKELEMLLGDLGSVQTPEMPQAYWGSILPRVWERIEEKKHDVQLPRWVFAFLMPGAAAVLLLVLGIRLLSSYGGGNESDIRAVVAEAPGEAVQSLASLELAGDVVVAGGLAGARSSLKGDDVEIIRELVAQENDLNSLAVYEPESSVASFKDEEINQLLTRMDGNRIPN